MKKVFSSMCSVLFPLLLLWPTHYGHAASPQNISIECPPNVTVDCTADLSNLDKWGTCWVLEDYKKTTSLKPTKIAYNTNACGIGTIVRTYIYEDKHWQTHSCEQIITVTGNNGFSEADISWPPYYELEGCNPNADPKNLPKPYNYPSFTKRNCAQPMYSYSDMKFYVADGCSKILREWKVIDWCTYVPNQYPQKGVYTYTQIIKLIAKDSTAKIICPKDTIVDAKKDCKGAYVKLDSAFAFSKCGNIYKIVNTSAYADAKGPNASGFYPIGTTEFYYIAEYGCGKELKCKVSVTVKNKIGPTPYCLIGLIVALMPVDNDKDGIPEDGMVEVWAKDVDKGSYHACGKKDLKFSFSSNSNDRSRVFTCADLGKNEVEMWVTDDQGNQSFCKTTIEIQNNNANIPDCKRKDSLTKTTTMLTLGGTISTFNNEKIENVELSLINTSASQYKLRIDTIIKIRYDTIVVASGNRFFIRRNDTSYVQHIDTIKFAPPVIRNSNKEGQYSFIDLTANQDYTLASIKKSSDLTGIDIQDVIVLLRHIMGTQKITSPYTLMAADINNDGYINYNDFELLYGLVNGSKTLSDLPVAWKIIPKSYVFLNPNNPLQENATADCIFKPLKDKIDNMDFYAIKVGELNGSSVNKIKDTELDIRSNTEEYGLKNIVSFPNPLYIGNINLQFDANQAGIIKFDLYDMNGKRVYANKLDTDKGHHIWPIEIPDYITNGIYFYRISVASFEYKSKLIIERE